MVNIFDTRPCEIDDLAVVDFIRYRVKNYSELTNWMKMYRIEGYNGFIFDTRPCETDDLAVIPRQRRHLNPNSMILDSVDSF